MSLVHAIFEGGVFKPQNPVSLPERCSVVFDPQVVSSLEESDGLDEIYEVLGRRYESGVSDTAERHNEHQP